MLLANYNIQEMITEQINLFLTNYELSFSELKSLILSKAPIPQVHSNIVRILTESKNKDEIKVKKNLETQAFKRQRGEDEKQKKHDIDEEVDDEDSKARLERELKHIPTQLINYETECRLLELKLHRLMEAAPKVEVSQHTNKNLKNTQSKSLEEHLRSVEKIKSTIQTYEVKIHSLLVEQSTIQIKLRDLEIRAKDRRERENRRTRRSQASIGYLSTGEGIEDTLSTKNQSLLEKSIQAQQNALDKKCSELIQDSEQINFPYFLEELPNHLAKKSINLSNAETEVLHAILKLMNQHLKFELQVANTEESLNKKNQSITSQNSKLQGFKDRLKSLQNSNPNLTEANKKLTALNSELSIKLKDNTNLRQRLVTPALLLFALTFIFTIPLILTVSGVIPFFIASALLYTLVSAPPALLLLATVAVGISALVFGIKAHSNDSEIKTNKQTIESNTNKMGKNSQSLKTLQTVTIPSLESQIKKDESSRDNLMSSLKNCQNQAKQALKQAKEIEPIAYSGSSLLKNKEQIATKSTDSEIEESSQEEEQDEQMSVELS